MSWPSDPLTFCYVHPDSVESVFRFCICAIYERDIVTILLQSTLVLFLSDADLYYEKAGNSLDDDDGNGKSYFSIVMTFMLLTVMLRQILHECRPEVYRPWSRGMKCKGFSGRLLWQSNIVKSVVFDWTARHCSSQGSYMFSAIRYCWPICKLFPMPWFSLKRNKTTDYSNCMTGLSR